MSPHGRLSMKIKRLRREKKWSQATLAKAAGVSREYLARLELGHHDPSLTTLQRLARALGVKVTELLR